MSDFLLIGLGTLVGILAPAWVWTTLRNKQLKAANLSLQRDNHLFTALLENTTDSIYFKDLHSYFVRCSRVMLRRFGISDPAVIVGKNDHDFYTEEHAIPALQDEQEVIRRGVAVEKEERETWPDGNITWASTAKMPLHD